MLQPGRAVAAEQLLSQGKTATASSQEGAGYAASLAVDGNTGTRWASQWSDDQWLQVDLGSSAALSRVVLNWEGAYGRAFRIQTSQDGGSWTTVHTETAGSGGNQTIAVSGTGRYVRLLGTQRGTGYGYSLWELQVYGETGGTGPVEGGTVEVTGSQGNWQLTVEGEPYTVKGLTWGPAIADAGRYMPDLASMGVNTIRTWGTDASTRPLLDTAAANGIRVIAGFWLQPGGGPGSGGCVDYVNDYDYKGYQLYLMNEWVAAYKDHPGVLMWNVGNESLLGLQNCYSGAELEAQRDAYARFINDAAREIHALDPNHPVTSTDAWTGAWPYYQEHSPELDLLAVNSYGAVCDIEEFWTAGGYDRPYILTEGGPAGEWETDDDVNGVPQEPTDVDKAEGYRDAWDCLMGHEGVALGGTLFHYGTERDFGGVWFNLLPGGERRLSYYAVADIFGGSVGTNTPPVVSNLTVSGSRTAVPAGRQFTLGASLTDPNGDTITPSVAFSSKYIDNNGALVDAQFTRQGNNFSVTAPTRPGVWKVYLLARDGRGNVGIETTTINVVPPPVPGTNIAQGRPTTASSYQAVGDGAPFPPSNATDGNRTTRWASDWSDPQWLQVDLGSVTTFQNVQLVWEGAFARAYQVQTSDNGTDWRTIHTVTNGTGGVDTAAVNGSGRYVRVLGTQRGTGWGYSLFEFGVYRS
ncbi:discoidin domain-containing protein [Streptomyces sp. NPDC049881]|uniref:galactose-binding domain-containing protein n=1 Tax=Streptomyces sp. NPDC049881 TaxID=3155778 RepID=UPI003431DF38